FAPEPVPRSDVTEINWRRCGARIDGAGCDTSEMGPDLLPGIDRCRRAWFHRHIGRLGRRGPLPVLCLRRDLPGAVDSGAHDLQGLAPSSAEAAPLTRLPRSSPGRGRTPDGR